MRGISKRRVVITGIGAVTPLANSAEESWQAVCQGKSGVARITRFDPTGFKTQIAAEIKNFHPENFLDKKKIRRTDQFIHYALAATHMALDNSGLNINDSNASRVGIVIGSCVGGMATYEKNLFALRDKGPKLFLPFSSLHLYPTWQQERCPCFSVLRDQANAWLPPAPLETTALATPSGSFNMAKRML